MSATPIYTELQQTVMDPETTEWDVSAPPAFAAALADKATAHEPATPEQEGTTDASGQHNTKRGSHSSASGKNTRNRNTGSKNGTKQQSKNEARADSNTARGHGNRRHRADE